MSFVETPHDYPYPWYIRPLLAAMGRQPSGLPEPVRLWARMPGALIGFLLLNRFLERRGSPLGTTLRALVRTRIAQLNACHFCVDLNASRVLGLGIPEDKLRDLAGFATSPHYSEGEKAALAYAEAVTRPGIAIDADLIEILRRTYGDQGLVELAALIAQQNLSAKFNAALGVPAQGYCPSGHGFTD